MRKNTFTTILGAVALWGMSLLWTGCDFQAATDAVEDLKIVIGLDSIETVVAGQILDAGTGELITNKVNLTFTGTDRALLIDLFSEPVADQEVTGGMTSFGIKNEATPTASTPVRFQINASVTGYEPTSIPVTIDHKGETSFRIYMVRKGTIVEGSAVNTTSGQAVGGTVQTTITASAAVSGTQSAAQVTVPQGTVAKDASGTPLSGALTASVTYFSTENTQALRSMPGGQATRTNTGDATLVTAGFASIDVTDASGREASTFTGGKVDIRFDVPATTLNPLTGQPVKNGEKVNVYSFKEAEGIWQKEGEATLEGPTNGVFTARYEASHLSWWNVAWESETCSVGATLNVSRNGHQGPIQVVVTGSGFTSTYTVPAGQNALQLPNMPRRLNGKAAVMIDGNQITTSVSDMCSGSYSLTLPQAAQTVDVQFSLVPKCRVSGEAVRVQSIPTTMIMYRKKGAAAGTPWLAAGSPSWIFDTVSRALVRGELVITGLEVGQEYTFKTTYEGETYSTDQKITGPVMRYEETVDDDYCN